MTNSYELEIKDKGRVVFPSAFRTACGFDVGTHLRARPIGPGQAIVETTDVVLERLWSGAPSEPSGAVDELWRWRASEASELGRTAEVEDTASNEAGDRLLRALGLS
jgi:bifunctional DNA-binding transcriptional regulator/antitoxin component of YhaV-PrlF toxin-antitoxin module